MDLTYAEIPKEMCHMTNNETIRQGFSILFVNWITDFIN